LTALAVTTDLLYQDKLFLIILTAEQDPIYTVTLKCHLILFSIVDNLEQHYKINDLISTILSISNTSC